jgi:hypothetical protein
MKNHRAVMVSYLAVPYFLDMTAASDWRRSTKAYYFSCPDSKPGPHQYRLASYFHLKVGCLHPVACTRSGSGFPLSLCLKKNVFVLTLDGTPEPDLHTSTLPQLTLEQTRFSSSTRHCFLVLKIVYVTSNTS